KNSLWLYFKTIFLNRDYSSSLFFCELILTPSQIERNPLIAASTSVAISMSRCFFGQSSAIPLFNINDIIPTCEKL
ncbi:unnamed protein product, partial [Oikopleura dioica]